jgi:hypothetical protein
MESDAIQEGLSNDQTVPGNLPRSAKARFGLRGSEEYIIASFKTT